MKKKTQIQRFTEYMEIRLSYKYMTEAEIAKEYHVSYSEISKALRGSKYNHIKEARLNRIKAHKTNKTLTTKDFNNHKTKEKSANDSAKSKSVNPIRKISSENEAKVSQLAHNPVNNVSKVSSVNSSTPNTTPAKDQPTSNLPSVSTPPKTPENTDDIKLSNWDLIKSYLKKALENWLKNILDDIDLKLHHNYEDRP